MDDSLTAQHRDLCSFLTHHGPLYYDHAAPEIPDSVYDAKFQELLTLEREHPELVTLDSPSQRVGGNVLNTFESVTHKHPMLSLDNAFDKKDIEDFMRRVKDAIPDEDIIYAVEPKLDGLALSTHYSDHVLEMACTRGDGKVGEDVTVNARTVPTLPLRIPGRHKTLEVRGELLMPKASFEEYNAKALAEGKTPFVNCRNAAAGTMRSKDPKEAAKRKMDFIPYGVYDENGKAIDSSHALAMAELSNLGFSRAKYFGLARTAEDVEILYRHLLDARDGLPYDIDGMVIKIDCERQQSLVGMANRAPKWAIAYKFPAEQAMTRLVSVVFQLGRYGQVTPVAKVEPVFVGGVTVSSITLHNADELKRLNLHHGDALVVQRAGDVVPQIVSVVESERKEDALPVEFLTHCPSCETPLQQNPGEVAHYCPSGSACPQQLIAQLKHFVKRDAMNIDGLAVKTIEKAIEEGLVKDPSDFYSGFYSSLVEDGSKSARKLIAAIDKSTTTTFARFIYALGIPDVGSTTSKDLAEHFVALDKLLAAHPEEIAVIEGVGDKVANSVYDWFGKLENLELVARLQTFLTWPEVVTERDESNPYYGKTVCITGSFTGFSRNEAKEVLRNLGAKVGSSVSAKTDILFAGENAGTKLAKALDLNVTTLGQSELEQLM